MFRLILGICIGFAVAYYTVPEVNKAFSSFNVSTLTQIVGIDDTHTSNTLNATAPSDYYEINRQHVSTEIRTAISLIGANNPNAQTSEYAVKLITELVEDKPELQTYVRSRLSNGLTNKEALNIFERYFSLQS